VTGARADGDCYRIEAMPEAPADSIHPKSALAWRTWLEPHHARGQGVWLISYKLAAGKPRMAYDEAVADQAGGGDCNLGRGERAG